MRRLDDDALDVLCVLEHPRRLGGTHGGSGVEHQLFVLLGADRHAITELPVDDVGGVTNAAQQIARTEHTRQVVTKADNSLNGDLHLFFRVKLVQRGERGVDLVVNHLLVKRLVSVGGAQQRGHVVEYVGHDVVQESALVSVDAAG